MDKRFLEECLAKGMSLKQVAIDQRCSVGTVSYWVHKFGLEIPSGSKFAPHLVAVAEQEGRTSVNLVCRRHGLTEHRIDPTSGWPRCTKCRARNVSEWRRRTKRLLVEEAGGSCVNCGYDRCTAALQFHHLDPATKAFHISRRGRTRSIDKLRKEVAKCVLLCANCHAEVEVGFTELEEVPVTK